MVAAARFELAPPKRLVIYNKRFKAITLYFVTNQKSKNDRIIPQKLHCRKHRYPPKTNQRK